MKNVDSLEQALNTEISIFKTTYELLYDSVAKVEERKNLLKIIRDELLENRDIIESIKNSDPRRYERFCDLGIYVDIALIEFDNKETLENINDMRSGKTGSIENLSIKREKLTYVIQYLNDFANVNETLYSVKHEKLNKIEKLKHVMIGSLTLLIITYFFATPIISFIQQCMKN